MKLKKPIVIYDTDDIGDPVERIIETEEELDAYNAAYESELANYRESQGY